MMSELMKKILFQGESVLDENLYACVESLYLTGQKNYVLSFHPECYGAFEKVFDRLIQKHGIREVEFHFEMNEADKKIEIFQI